MKVISALKLQTRTKKPPKLTSRRGSQGWSSPDSDVTSNASTGSLLFISSRKKQSLESMKLYFDVKIWGCFLIVNSHMYDCNVVCAMCAAFLFELFFFRYLIVESTHFGVSLMFCWTATDWPAMRSPLVKSDSIDCWIGAFHHALVAMEQRQKHMNR